MLVNKMGKLSTSFLKEVAKLPKKKVPCSKCGTELEVSKNDFGLPNVNYLCLDCGKPRGLVKY